MYPLGYLRYNLVVCLILFISTSQVIGWKDCLLHQTKLGRSSPKWSIICHAGH